MSDRVGNTNCWFSHAKEFITHVGILPSPGSVGCFNRITSTIIVTIARASRSINIFSKHVRVFLRFPMLQIKQIFSDQALPMVNIEKSLCF